MGGWGIGEDIVTMLARVRGWCTEGGGAVTEDRRTLVKVRGRPKKHYIRLLLQTQYEGQHEGLAARRVAPRDLECSACGIAKRALNSWCRHASVWVR